MDDIKFNLLTWKDVERRLLLNKKDWPAHNIVSVDAFPGYITIYYDEMGLDWEESVTLYLSNLFGVSYDSAGRKIYTRFDKGICVEFCSADDESVEDKRKMPLFRDVVFEESAYSDEIVNNPLPGVPVVAFHSYKGGVGRTLALLAYAKAWTNGHSSDKKLLIIDSDLEAPGITWLMEEDGYLSPTAASYLDFLDLLNESNDIHFIVSSIAESLKSSIMRIEDSNKRIEHYTMPVYRYVTQLLDLYTKPENIVYGMGKEYSIADSLSLIGKELNVGAVLVDLRAGISEYSAPLLFDPRVVRHIVTTTSDQSIMGTCLLLGQINKGIKLTDDSNSPQVLVTMVQNSLDSRDIRNKIIDQYVIDGDDVSLADGIVRTLPYDSKFIHLGNWNDIMNRLNGTDFYLAIKQIVEEKYPEKVDEEIPSIQSSRQDVIKRLHTFASLQITAEGNSEFQILTTTPIENLAREFRDGIPTAVVMGAKGSGKTFLYREMLRIKKWGGFLDSVEPQAEHTDNNSYFLPIVEGPNGINFNMYNGAIKKELGERLNVNIELNYLDIRDKILQASKADMSEKETCNFWEQLFLLPFGNRFESFKDLEQYLVAKNTRIVFLTDGLEEVLQDVHVEEKSKILIRGLAQTLVGQIRTNYTHIGCVLFVRSDMVQDAFKVNYEQFNSLYKNFALKWSQDEALRLAAWVCNKAVPEVFKFPEGVTGSDASESEINKILRLLWGKKLGKDDSNEAYSSRWILAALSDFNAQLQARDMIRFIELATADTGKEKYQDRIIMPTEIRNAVSACSEKKIEELKMERPTLNSIFSKMKEVDQSKKMLPLIRGEFGISFEEEEVLRKEGFLIESDDKWYLPEIIRHALGYRYSRGARPKVLSLLIK